MKYREHCAYDLEHSDGQDKHTLDGISADGGANLFEALENLREAIFLDPDIKVELVIRHGKFTDMFSISHGGIVGKGS